MLTDKGKRILIIVIAAVVCVAGIGGFAVYNFVLADNTDAGEPSEVAETRSTPTPPSTPPPTPPPTHPPPKPAPISSYIPFLTGDELITIELAPEDIHNGFLVLINDEFGWEIPENLDLVRIADYRTADFRISSSSSAQQLHRAIMEPLNRMMQGFYDSRSDAPTMYVISAFRTPARQQQLFNMYGSIRAKRGGHSEHHTGFAFDLGTNAGGGFENFSSTSWFFDNAHRHGFILRYPRGKTAITGTMYEPWHYRYVGIPHSFIMYNNNWVLEEYIDKIRPYTQENPFATTLFGVDYEVFYTDSESVTLPAHAEYTISGNNIDGFIVTIFARYDRLANIVAE